MEEPAVGEVSVDGLARFLAELAHHVVFADEKFLSQTFDGQILGKVGVDIAQHFHDPRILRGVRAGGQGGAAVEISARLGQKLEQQAAGQDLPAEFVPGQLLFQLFRQGEELALFLLSGPQDGTCRSGKNFPAGL